MAIRYSKERAFDLLRPQQMTDGASTGGDLRVRRCIFDLATDGAVTTADQIDLGVLPAGSVFVACLLTVSATLGTAVVAIGTSLVHASNGQYRAAAVQTAIDAPNLSGVTAAKAAAKTTGPTPIYLTVGTASLPGAGTIVADIVYAQVA